MTYTDLPGDEVPVYCSVCGQKMKREIVGLTPFHPVTGRMREWEVVHCPWHDNGVRGSMHHTARYQRWYHDAFKIRMVKDFDGKPPSVDPGTSE